MRKTCANCNNNCEWLYTPKACPKNADGECAFWEIHPDLRELGCIWAPPLLKPCEEYEEYGFDCSNCELFIEVEEW